MAACTDSKGEKHKARIRTKRFDSKKRSNCIKKKEKKSETIPVISFLLFSFVLFFFFFSCKKIVYKNN